MISTSGGSSVNLRKAPQAMQVFLKMQLSFNLINTSF